MRKLLSVFGAVGLIATSASTVVACGGYKWDDSEKADKNFKYMVEGKMVSGDTTDVIETLKDADMEQKYIDQATNGTFDENGIAGYSDGELLGGFIIKGEDGAGDNISNLFLNDQSLMSSELVVAEATFKTDFKFEKNMAILSNKTLGGASWSFQTL